MEANNCKISTSWKLFWELLHPNGLNKLIFLEERLGYRFANRELLFEALAHRSASESINMILRRRAKDHKVLPWNERLEFLGDSVVGLIIASLIFQRNLEELKAGRQGGLMNEGDLSKVKSQLVSASKLAKIARKLGLDQVLVVSKAERKLAAHERDSLLSDALEALLGAVYLDSGYDTTARVVTDLYGPNLLSELEIDDPKSTFQELAQVQYDCAPTYCVESESGPAHAKRFVVGAYLGPRKVSEAEGPSKKQASRLAALKALKLEAHAITKDANK